MSAMKTYNQPQGGYINNKNWYIKRNKQIYEDKMNGMGSVELISKYKISNARLHMILKREVEKCQQQKKLG